MEQRSGWQTCLLVVFTLMGLMYAPLAYADSTNGDIFYTTFQGTDRVFHRTYSFDGTVLGYGTENVIASITPGGLQGSDGLVFDPTNTQFLLVGGQNGFFYRVDTTNGNTTASSNFAGDGATIFHLVIDPSQASVWGTGIPDSPAVNLSLTPFNGGSLTRTISGDVSAITGLAFVGSDAYYASSGPSGVGSFGRIDLSTGVTTQIFGSVPAAHGLVFDSFTGDLILTGDSEISQYHPASNSLVSTLHLDNNTFDQGTADGKGHLFVASNDGDMLFVDYSGTHLVGDAANFTDIRHFRDFLDDVAPLSGPGSHQPEIPEPSTLLLLGLGGLGSLVGRSRRRPIVA